MFRRVSEPQRALSADRQTADPGSVLNFTQRLLAWRKGQKILRIGDQRLDLAAPNGVLAFTRHRAGERLVCAANFGNGTATFGAPAGARISFEGGGVALRGDSLSLDSLAFAALA